jgi:hypothetical protein
MIVPREPPAPCPWQQVTFLPKGPRDAHNLEHICRVSRIADTPYPLDG